MSKISLLICALVAGSDSVPAWGQLPEGAVLLRGVEQARKPLHGKFHLKLTRQAANNTGSLETDVEFDRSKWRFTETNDVVVSSPNQLKDRNRVIEANKGDPSAAVKAGLGKWAKETVRTVFDGNQMVQYSDQGGGHIRVHQKGSGTVCFDPRILGVARLHGPAYLLPDCLAIGEAGQARTVGQEEVNGKVCWHVVFTHPEPYKLEYHYWINDVENFRVYQYQYRTTDTPPLIVTSKLHYANATDGLPIRVDLEEVCDQYRSTDRLELSQVDFTFRPEPEIFSFKGLNMPPGAMVIDDRIQRVVGYFNGTDLSKDRDDAMSQSAELAVQEVRPAKGSGWPLYALLAVIGLAVGVIGYRWFRHRPN